MVLAAFRDGLYDFVLLLHILAVLAAFAPAVVNPVTIARVKPDGDSAVAKAASVMVANAKQIHIPALVAIAPLGIVLVALSDDVWEFSDTWVSLSFLVWIAICGIVTGIILPGERAVAGGDMAAEKRVALGGQLATVALLVILYLMIFKPGA